MLPFWQAKKLCQVSLSAIILKKKRFSVRHYIQQDGNIVISNEEWSDVGIFSKNGLAPVYKESSGWQEIGYITDNGTLALPFIYSRFLSEYISYLGHNVYDFSNNGLVLVNYNKNTFFIRSDGRRAFEGLYEPEYFYFCPNGLAFVGKMIKTGDRYMSLGSSTRKVGEEFKTVYQVIDSDGKALLSVNENYPCKQGSIEIEAVVRNDGKVVWPLNLTAACKAKSADIEKANRESKQESVRKQSRSSSSSSGNQYSSDDLRNLAYSINQGRTYSYYADKISNSDLRNLAYSINQGRTYSYYADKISNSDLRNLAYSINQGRTYSYYADKISNSDLRNLAYSINQGGTYYADKISNSDLRNLAYSINQGGTYYADKIR
jgi:hypothetical protein